MRNQARWLVVLASLSLAPVACGGAPEPERPEKTATKKQTPDEVLAAARADRDAGRIGQAIETYHRALRMRPDHYETVDELSKLLIDQSKPGEAVEITKGFFDRQPADLRGYSMYANALVGAGSYKQAEDVLTQLTELDAKNAAAFNFRARVRVFLDKLPEAVADARKAVELGPDVVEHHIDLGSVLKRSGSLEEAAIALRGALQLDENNARAHLLLGNVLRDNYDFKEALTHHYKAVRLDPDNDRAHFELGVSLFAMQDPLGAEQSLKKAVELAPKDATNWYAYGQALRALEKWDAAVAAYKRAIEIDPKHDKAHVKLGFVRFQEGKLDEAEVVLTAALRQTPDDPYIYWNLGEVYRTAGKLKLAIEAYETFLEKAPEGDGDVPKAKKYIRSLKREIRRRR